MRKDFMEKRHLIGWRCKNGGAVGKRDEMILSVAYLLYDTLKVIPDLAWSVFVNNHNINDTCHCFIKSRTLKSQKTILGLRNQTLVKTKNVSVN